MPSCTFFHPDIPSSAGGPYLTISSGIDEASWSYNLNTVSYPTYGGEVVQILSCNIGDLTVTGTLPSYNAMERVYQFFAYFLQIATQGRGQNTNAGSASYNQTPITFTYPERGWSFQIIPKALRRFRYANDVVAPEWGVTAHIVDHSNDLSAIKEFTEHQVLDNFLKSDGEKFDTEGKIGFLSDNPFSAPITRFGTDFDPDDTRAAWKDESDRFNEVIEAYLDSDLEALYESVASRPAWGQLQDQATEMQAENARLRADWQRKQTE